MSNPSVFQFQDHYQLRVVSIDGELWFVASDLAVILEYSHTPHLVRIVEDDEKGVHNLDTRGGTQSVTIISQPGLFRILAVSRSVRAKPFQHWLFHEVLPSIVRNGYYAKPQDLPFDNIPPIEQPFQKVHPLLFSELRRMNKGMAQAYLVECGVTPDYVSGQLKKIDDSPVYRSEASESKPMPSGALAVPDKETYFANIKVSVVRVVRNKGGKDGLSEGSISRYYKPYGRLGKNERQLMIDQLLVSRLLVLVRTRTKSGQTTCRLVHPDFAEAA